MFKTPSRCKFGDRCIDTHLGDAGDNKQKGNGIVAINVPVHHEANLDSKDREGSAFTLQICIEQERNATNQKTIE